ncbi:MAG TPA: tripartite tricarboxylate transporter substrate binding protein [Burkholderiales bacterium]|nr:tripartite tricarboxylate transporter substrate binding protein [Burkholderiales bacterium]
MKRLAILLLLAGAALNPARAQYPVKPIRIVEPFPPGNATDIILRAFTPELGELLKQTFVIDPRPGAGGNIAADIVAKSTPDGYTLFIGTIGTHAINASLYSRLPYDPVRDFTPISLVATNPNALVVNLALPAHSVKELIALARARPGALNFGSSGSGTSVHLSGELFKTMAGVSMVHVPYKSATDALTDLMAGRLQLMFASLSSSVQFIRAGKLRALGVTSAERHASIPDVPTIAEAGLPGFEATAWFGILGPAGTPQPIVVRLNQAIVEVLKRKEVRERMSNAGVDAISSTPEHFAAYIKSELAKWDKVVRASGARAD